LSQTAFAYAAMPYDKVILLVVYLCDWRGGSISSTSNK